MYLTDEYMLEALKSSAKSLSRSPITGDSGLIFVKDNVIHWDKFEYDSLDNSVVRPMD